MATAGGDLGVGDTCSDSSYDLRQDRSLTGHALDVYQNTVQQYWSALEDIFNEVTSVITDFEQQRCTFEDIRVHLIQKKEQFQKSSFMFERYLKSVRCDKSTQEQYLNASKLQTLQNLIDSVIQEHSSKLKDDSDISSKTDPDKTIIKKEIHTDSEREDKVKSPSVKTKVFQQDMTNKNVQPTVEISKPKVTKPKSKMKSLKSKLSTLSSHSRKSKGSDVGLAFVTQKAKVEELRVRMDYAKKEAELLKQKAAIEATMKVLDTEREFNECAQGCKVLEEYLESSDEESSVDTNLEEIQKDRTEEFVQDQNQRHDEHEQLDMPVKSEHREKPEIFTGNLNANATTFIPSTNDAIAKFIVKKDLLLSRIQKFDDTPEYFGTWKRSFTDTVNELGLTHSEEVDLLVKYLGPESTKSAISIRSANFTNTSTALNRIWERLHDRYARPEMVESSIKQKLNRFQKVTNREYKRLYELVDIVTEVESIKADPIYHALFAYYDSSAGVNQIVSKLPFQLQEKWTNEANRYKENNAASYPPFNVFVKFLNKMARLKNDPSFMYENNTKPVQTGHHVSVAVRKTETKPASESKTYSITTTGTKPACEMKTYSCPIHQTNHTLNKCRQFRQKPLQERREFIKSAGLCFKCCGQKGHLARDCQSSVTCEVCKSTRHPTALHIDRTSNENNFSQRQAGKTEVEKNRNEPEHKVNSTCTKICKDTTGTSKSCAKTVLVRVYPKDNLDNSILLYAIIDEQSNRSLAKKSFFDHFNVQGPEISYSLSSCSGNSTEYGRRAYGFVIESLDHSSNMNLPTLIECDEVPNIRQEIPSPEVAHEYAHLRDIEHLIPEINDNAEIQILIGRDLLMAHHVLDQRLGQSHLPYAQQLHLGWVIIGETCLSATHEQESVSVLKTFTLKDGRTTSLEPCKNDIKVQDDQIFVKTMDDDTPGLSIEDKQFLSLMDQESYRDEDGSWTAPLPFRENRQCLPNNHKHALRRARTLDTNLKRTPEKQRQMLDFLEKIFTNRHAEIAPPLEPNQECWYLPLFPVYHPKKPGNIRCVFDSSAKFEGVSLNDVLLTGPDLVNSLIGILLRFRQKPIAITADVEQMFYCFSVPLKHRDFLRFYWYRNNDPTQDLIEYRMTRHVFGNSPSPAVATYELRQTVSKAETDVREFVEKNFYVDDGLASFDTIEEAVSLVSKTQTTLMQEGNIRLHKISSNSVDVLKSFSESDLCKDVKGINLDLNQAPLQRSLGVIWDVSSDSFTFKVDTSERPFTKRGVLSVINGLYDPIGCVAPVTIAGKIIMRDVMYEKTDWDEPLLNSTLSRWNDWKQSLVNLETLRIPRSYTQHVSDDIKRRELHVFCDASKDAICAVAYLKLYDVNGYCSLSFVHGKAKVAPRHGHTIPRLELCSAVLAVNLKDSISRHLTLKIDETVMYTDSQIVLGYINNEQRRFYVYVGNRVDLIRQSTQPNQWKHIASEKNPADIGTRSISIQDFMTSEWLSGPQVLMEETADSLGDENFQMVNPDNDKEVRPNVVTKKTVSEDKRENSESHGFFKSFSSWNKLVRAVTRLKHIARCFAKPMNKCKGWHMCQLSSEDLLEAEIWILKQAQQCYSKEITALMEGRQLPTSSSISSLTPIIDEKGLLRVGGRLELSKNVSRSGKHPIIVPKKHHISILLIRHIHELVRHQGRHITEGRIRLSGYWIVGCKRMVNTVIHNCVICKKLRGRMGTQIMADLPEDRISECPPFTFVGVDAFGPWNVVTRKTRGGQANKKRWAILFTCLVIRAIHIEVVEELSSSSFINALRRFTAIRGPVRQFRSDRGTNFVAAANELGMNSIYVEDQNIRNFLDNNRITWVFNPPHASHFGGAWERMIGVTRRILDAILLRNISKELTHEVLTTFMSEVCSVVNSRPLVPVSTDPQDTSVLTPNILLTQKVATLPDTLPALNTKDVYRSQWKHVIVLSQEFWKKWREQYLSNLQYRRKWATQSDDFKEGDIVLLKDHEVQRTYWPMAIIERTFPSKDNHVRKVEIRVANSRKVYVRPICELVPLLSV